MRRPRRSLALSSRRRRLLLESLVLLCACRLVLALGSVRTTRRVIDPLVSALGRLHSDSTATPADLTWAVETGDTLLPGTGTCLHAAIVGDALLETYGYDATLRIGVAKDDDGALEAHAWLERDDQVVVGDLSGLSRFQPLPLDTVDRLTDSR